MHRPRPAPTSPGCLASWLTATVDTGNPALPSNLATAGTYIGKIDLTMQDSGTNQNPCQNAAPAVDDHGVLVTGPGSPSRQRGQRRKPWRLS